MKHIKRIDIRNFLEIGAINSIYNEQYLSSLDKNSGLSDPTYFSFFIDFEFFPKDNIPGWSSAMNSLLYDEYCVDSGINYLLRINKEKEAGYLSKFVSQLKNISKEKPWYFQKISGLETLIIKPEDGKTRRTGNLKIECLETIDWQMQFLFDLYQKASYEMRSKKHLLPYNMRTFNMRVIVGEVRDLYELVKIFQDDTDVYEEQKNWYQSMNEGFTTIDDTITEVRNELEPKQKTYFEELTENQKFEKIKFQLHSLDKYLSFRVIDCFDCQFVFNDFSSYSSISNAEIAEAISFNFEISVGDAYQTTRYGFFEWVISEMDDSHYTNDPQYLNNTIYNFKRYLEKDIKYDYEKYTHAYQGDLDEYTKNLNQQEEYDHNDLANVLPRKDAQDAEAEMFGLNNLTDKAFFQSLKQVGKEQSAKYLTELETVYNAKKFQIKDFASQANDFTLDKAMNPEFLNAFIDKSNDKLKNIVNLPDKAMISKINIEESESLNILETPQNLQREIPKPREFNDEWKNNPIVDRPLNQADLVLGILGKFKKDIEIIQTPEQFELTKTEFINDIQKLHITIPDVKINIDRLTNFLTNPRENLDKLDIFFNEYLKKIDRLNIDRTNERLTVDNLNIQRTPERTDIDKININTFNPKINIDNLDIDRGDIKDTLDKITQPEQVIKTKLDELEKNNPQIKETPDNLDKNDLGNEKSVDKLPGINPFVEKRLEQIPNDLQVSNKKIDKLTVETTNVRNIPDTIEVIRTEDNKTIDNFDPNTFTERKDIDKIDPKTFEPRTTMDKLDILTTEYKTDIDKLISED